MLDDITNVFAINPESNTGQELNIGLSFGLSTGENCNENRIYNDNDRRQVIPPKHTMKLRLTSDTPFYGAPRRLSYSDRIEVDRIINDLLSKGIIRPSDSPYASPIVLMKKKNGEFRMCVDYRWLIKLTVRDNFPLPLIENCLEYLDSKICFSLLDLKNGFHQVKMDTESIKYTSFVTPPAWPIWIPSNALLT